MARYIITALLFISIGVKAQQPISYASVDSTTYTFYIKGDWEKLIRVGKDAISKNIDFKWLRQRIGYAYFVKADYYAAQMQYEKALTFDEIDPMTREYLYYCGLYTGDDAYARFHGVKLTPEAKKRLGIEKFKPVDAVDMEFNYKSNDSQLRSNPTYLRAGISTKLGYRMKLYQSVSNYQQTIDTAVTKQPEYFALVDWSLTSHISLDIAYHYLSTSYSGTKIPGNLVFAKLSTSISRFNLGLNGSFLSSSLGQVKQFGLFGGVTLPGKSNIYLNSSLTGMIETSSNRIIYSQIAGLRLTKMLWAEGSVILGNLNNFNNYNALYVYNSVDPTTFRTGLTLYWYLGKKTILFCNYTYDQKQITNTTINYYNQHSFSGGIIWKL